MTNPLLSEWTTKFGLPPFAEIEDAHFAPAFVAGIAASRQAVAAIADDPAPATFDNTIRALEEADPLLERVASVFFNLAGSQSNPAREALQRDLAPKLAALSSEMMMNAALYARVRTVFDARGDLPAEAARVTDLWHRRFVRAGAALNGADRARLKDVLERLAALGTQFSQNVLADERAWAMALTEEEAADLPEFLRSSLRAAAEARTGDGHVLTLSPSVMEPFLASCPRRDLRETAFRAWKSRGRTGGDTDNTGVIAETLALRSERARLLGFDDFASYKLAEEMAGEPSAVRTLLDEVWSPARNRVLADAAALEALMREDGINDDLRPWDWLYYAEKRRRRDHDLDEAALKPYLQLDAMIAAAFDCATRLFGLTFEPLDVDLYDPTCRAWEARQGDRHMGVFIGDYFARSSKRSGAWCSRFRAQSAIREQVRPIVVNVCNFAQPADGAPALLSFEDARTLFHEFGHALHTLMSDLTYPSISGTSVARDFVELPSQLYEHWLSVPDVLLKFARHAETGAPMPAEMLERLLAAENADQGFATVTYVASAQVDLAFHSGPPPADPLAAQAAVLARIGMPDALTMRHEASHFQHVFAGDGYSSGYYSYMWSEVMDADAFAAFEEAGDPFDPDVAARLAEHIYAAGGSQDPKDLYRRFRGAMPGVDALLKKRGLAA